jgi:hypothetical protein
MFRYKKLMFLALGALLVVGAAIVLRSRGWPRAFHEVEPLALTVTPSDPRLTFLTPFQNVSPTVKYVGNDKCAECHESTCASYSQHPMSRSLARVSAASQIHRYDSAPRPYFESGDRRYQVERRGERLYHKESAVDATGEVIAADEVEVQYVVGSGRRGVSYLVDRDGYLFMSPITWYPQKRIWDLSPGYAATNLHFSRPIIAECLFCHSNQVSPEPDAPNHYRHPIFEGESIGCERCHGPGELHVAHQSAGQDNSAVDYTIVNPRHLEHSLREAVCEQCHLQGEERVVRHRRQSFDFRPGLPLHLFLADFIKSSRDTGPAKFVGTVEQMHASRCYQMSAGESKMGCISCHDPHGLPASDKKTAHYRDKCLSCHESAGCSLPVAVRRKKVADDSCIACHMPQTGSDIQHTSITDHSIPRNPDRDRGSEPSAPTANNSVTTHHSPLTTKYPLVPFYASALKGDDPEVLRDLSIALIERTEKEAEAAARSLADLVLPLSEAAAARDPDDAPAWEAWGRALWHLQKLEQALAVFASGLERSPRRERTLFFAATLALRLKRMDAARDYVRRLLNVNPWSWKYYRLQAYILAGTNDWEGAIVPCRRALELEPFDLTTRKFLVGAFYRAGRSDDATREFDKLSKLTPASQREQLNRELAKIKAAARQR